MISVKRYAIFKALLTEPNPTAIRCSSTTSTARILISTIVSSATGATSTFTAGTLRTSSSISRQIPWSGGTRLRPRRETRGRPATGFRRYAMESIDFEEGTAVPVGLAIKTVAATLGFGLYLRFRNILPRPSTIRTKNVQLFVFAGIFNTLFLLGYYVALEIVPVSVVVPLHITSSLFVIVFSYLFMPQRLEHITWKLAASAVVVVSSVALIIVFRNETV